VIESHDRSKFFVIGYSSFVTPDEVTDAIRARCDAWRDITNLDDERAAALIREDRIDVLVDLGGHTNSRLLLFARRPAPAQATWIGYPNTTGLRQIDYRITDAIADPPGEADALHTEKLLRLPDGFLCYRPPDEAPATDRADGPVTFASFNNFSKVTPRAIDAWAEILRQVPQARLMLKAKGLNEPVMQERARESFVSRGIDAQRVEVSRQQPSRREHFEQYRSVDVALDTFPYNGTTTTCDALWMGVPVVSLAGRTHVSRVGASLLARVGLNELVAGSVDAYVGAAVELARDSTRLHALRSELRDRMKRSTLTDAVRFTRAYEESLRTAWAQRHSERSR
jgi:predicted O-linked N-acetylglucosamine transferase (SPINDLY family)